MLVAQLLGVLAVGCFAQTTPVARHLVVLVDPGQDVVVTLKGYSLSGLPLTYTITSLPTQGSLYQLSQVFSDYGYDPKKQASPLAAIPSPVTGSKARVVFSRPFTASPLDSKVLTTTTFYQYSLQFAEFTYTVNDGATTSQAGIVTVSQGAAVMSSQFYFDTDGWSIVHNHQNSPPVFDPTSRGALSYYIYGTDAMIHTDPITASDRELWYFSAPPKFLGNQWYAYGGSLDFILAASEGDFTAVNAPASAPLVILDCATCNLNAGVRLAWAQANSPTFTGVTTAYSVPLLETSGWLMDPKNTLLPWTVPTQCQLVEVLTKLSGISILGDFTQRYETVALDSVLLLHGPGQPMACY
uniref:Secreted protein n=1 Tax=Achlya hypogyna TaxID=1202772 RepID=A0A0A7CPF5_ACHHY|nr:secreted protein [Achlya hypogyna]